ncbi:hypothetical protein GIB67_009297 [Kingdonia uniflora]|uniref:Uncharacterized protein n=1 Tax=Kingdonia uniflora TaxID=39325 RepID=A0A7J7N3D1_9MAGN|nr:hypothetical protein GIB67_009297 [Kingdonia uniflora]
MFRVGFVGPVGHFWYEYLDRFMKVRLQLPPKSIRFVAAEVALDGIIFGPLDLCVFFTYMGLTSAKSIPQVKEDLKRDFLPTLVLEGGCPFIIDRATGRCSLEEVDSLFSLCKGAKKDKADATEGHNHLLLSFSPHPAMVTRYEDAVTSQIGFFLPDNLHQIPKARFWLMRIQGAYLEGLYNLDRDIGITDDDDKTGARYSKPNSNELASAINEGLYFYEQKLRARQSNNKRLSTALGSRDGDPKTPTLAHGFPNPKSSSSSEKPGHVNFQKRQKNSPSNSVAFFFGSTPPESHCIASSMLSAAPHGIPSGSSPPVDSLQKPFPPF